MKRSPGKTARTVYTSTAAMGTGRVSAGREHLCRDGPYGIRGRENGCPRGVNTCETVARNGAAWSGRGTPTRTVARRTGNVCHAAAWNGRSECSRYADVERSRAERESVRSSTPPHPLLTVAGERAGKRLLLAKPAKRDARRRRRLSKRFRYAPSRTDGRGSGGSEGTDYMVLNTTPTPSNCVFV